MAEKTWVPKTGAMVPGLELGWVPRRNLLKTSPGLTSSLVWESTLYLLPKPMVRTLGDNACGRILSTWAHQMC